MSDNEQQRRAQKKLLYGTTVGMSADVLLRGQLRWFSDQGWEVNLATSPDSSAQMAAIREGVKLHPVPMERSISIANDIKSLFSWFRLLRKVRPDAVNLGTPKASLLGGIAAWALRIKKRVYVVRGLPLEAARPQLKPILWLMERLTIALATDVVVVSKSLGKALVRRRLVPAHKAWLIHKGSSNGVDTPAITARTARVDKKALRRELGIEVNAVVVGYIGRIAVDKGLGTLLRALQYESLTNNIEILLIGSLEDPELLEDPQDLNYRVHVIPWTDDVWGYLPVIDILCLPTYREGFPNVVLEAAAARIPAVTTRVTGAMDSVVDGETGFIVEPDDVPALAEKLNCLARNPRLRQAMGAAAHLRAHNDYEPETVWKGLAAILDKDYKETVLTRLDRIHSIGT